MRMFQNLKPLLFRGGVGVRLLSLALLFQIPTLLRLSIKDAKSRSPSPKEEGK
jgi:hypothetical protein